MSVQERPILFSAPMVRAILDGSKTQTRRVVKPQPKHRLVEPKVGLTIGMDPADDGGIWYDADGVGPGVPVRPPWRIGDRLWVRETFGFGTRPCPREGWRDGLEYRADAHNLGEHDLVPLYPIRAPSTVDIPSMMERDGWRPSIHMPRWASRILLEVTDVRVERVQEISDKDCAAEGVEVEYCCTGFECGCYGQPIEPPRHYFAALWDSINGKREGCSWDDDPWTWVVSFRRIKP